MAVKNRHFGSKSYAKLVNKAPGIMRPGLDSEYFIKATADDRTIFVTGTKVPLATPVEYFPWIRTEYIREQGVESDVYVYAGWPELWNELAVDPIQGHVMVLDQLADAHGVLVFEQSQQRDIRSLLAPAFLQANKQWRFKDVYTTGTLPDGDSITYRTDHHIYEAHYAPLKNTDEHCSNMSALYGAFVSDGTTELIAQLNTEEISKTYAEYAQAFSETRRHGAIDAIIPEEYFEEWMQDPKCLKYVQRDRDGITNMCVLTSVRNVDYMQPNYFRKKSPNKFASDEVLCCPIIYSRRGAPKGLGKKTTTGIARSFKAIQCYPKLIVECNDVSNKYMMRIFIEGAMAAGLALVVEDDSPLVQSVELAYAG